MVIAAVCQSAGHESRRTDSASRLGVGVEGLRVELAREFDDLPLVDRVLLRREALSDLEIVEKERKLCSRFTLPRRASVPSSLPGRLRCAQIRIRVNSA
jgi:hypothetical protein